MSDDIRERMNLLTNETAGRNPRLSPAHYAPPLEQGWSHREEAVDVQLLVRKLIKRKSLILIVMLVVLIPAVITTWLSTPLYQSVALIQIGASGARVFPYRDVADSGDSTLSYESLLRTQEQILKSPTLVDRVAKRRLDSAPGEGKAKVEAALLATKFQVKRIPESQVFELSYMAPSPELAAKIVNLFVEEYIKGDSEIRQAAREKARQALHKELEGLENRIQFSERELVEYAQEHKITSVDSGQNDPLQSKLALLEQFVVNAEAELAAAKSRLASVEVVSLQEFPEKLVTSQVQNLTTSLLGLEHDLTTMRASFGENWPTVIQKRIEVTEVQEKLKQEKAAALAQARQQALLDLRAVENRHRMMSASLAEQKHLLERVQQASIQYNILRREAETNRKLYEALLERFKQSGVMAGFEFGNIQVIEPGRIDEHVSSPKILWNLSLAFFLALALGVCVAFLVDFWNNSVATVEEAEQLVSLPALGCIPLIKPSKSPRLIERGWGRKPNGHLAERRLPGSPSISGQDGDLVQEVTEQIRNICASILLSRSEQTPQIIAFTSAAPMEGKTTLVSQVGWAFAEYGSKTLLVEADLRKPELSKFFGASGEAGLSLFLSGHVSPMPKIHSTQNPNLYVVAAGPKAPNPAALLNSERMQFFLRKVATSFQFVLLDCPPLLAFADPRILCSRADGTVLVVKAGNTTSKMLRRAKAILEDSSANVLGLILNGAEMGDIGSGYHRYYRNIAN